jgi:hypothetical protein
VTAVLCGTHGDTAGHNPVFCDRYPTRTCVAGNGGVRSSGDKCILHPTWDGNGTARRRCDCQHQGGRGLGLRSMVNTCEPLINVVMEHKPKVLGCLRQPNSLVGIHRLGLKGKGPGMGAPNSPTADVASPAERRDLTYAGTCAERGKPVDLPVVTATRESEPQGELMGLLVKDGGRSECLPVMRWIGVERGGCTVSTAERVHHPARKRADFLSRSLVTRKFGKPLSRGKADDGGLRPSWCAL